jgi:hypothetical protein
MPKITYPPHTRTSATAPTRANLATTFERTNTECASIILRGGSVLYPGLMTEWARKVVEGREAAERGWRLV